MNRKVISHDPDVSLTESELTVAGVRYDLGEIRSVDVVRQPAAATGPILMTVVGVICLLSAADRAGMTGTMLGVGLLAGAAAWWTRKTPTFVVSLQTEAGAATVFESRADCEAARVGDAIRDGLAVAGGETGRSG